MEAHQSTTNPFFIPPEVRDGREKFVENARGQLVGVRRDPSTGILAINSVPLITRDVAVSHSRHIKGEWALFANRDIRRGESFLDYGGDLVSNQAFEAAGDEYAKSGFTVCFPDGTMALQREYLKGAHVDGGGACSGDSTTETDWYHIRAVDAYPYVGMGSSAMRRVGAFANHSSTSPNAALHEESIFTHDDSEKRGLWLEMRFHSLRDIRRGEEILWDYGGKHWASRLDTRVIEPTTSASASMRAGPKNVPLSKKGDSSEEDDDSDHHHHGGKSGSSIKKHLPRVSAKNVMRVKKHAKTGEKVAKVVVPLVLL